MNKVREYIENTVKDDASYPGRLLISSLDFHKINELYEHLNDTRTTLTTTFDANRGFSPVSHTIDPNAIDIFFLLKKKLAKIKLLQIFCNDALTLHKLSVSKQYSSLVHLRLDMIPPSTLQGLYELRFQLQTLEICNSGITDLSSIFIPEAMFKKRLMNSLKPMVLSEKQYTIPMDFQWVQLVSLKLSNCGLSRLDESFHFMPMLQSLSIDRNQINHVIHLQDCYRLKFLNVSGNRISSLTNFHLVIGNLKVLDLSSNLIECFDGINKLFSLQQVNLSSNCVEDINEISYLAKLPLLEVLDLSGNPMSALPNYRLQVINQFIASGNVLGSTSVFPKIDGEDITDLELAKFKSVMFRSVDPTDTSTSLPKEDDEDVDSSIARLMSYTGGPHGDIYSPKARKSVGVKDKPNFPLLSKVRDRIRGNDNEDKNKKLLIVRPLVMKNAFNPHYDAKSENIISATYQRNEFTMKQYPNYRERCNPDLLEGWKSRRTKQLRDSHLYSHLVNVSNKAEDDLTIFPTLEEIRASVAIGRDKERLAKLKRMAYASENYRTPIGHSREVEIIDEKDLSQEMKRSVIGRLSSTESNPEYIQRILQDVGTPEVSNMENSMYVLSPEELKNEESIISIPVEANLLLNMNDLISPRDNLATLSSSARDYDSQATQNLVLPSAKYHDRLIAPPSLENATISTLTGTPPTLSSLHLDGTFSRGETPLSTTDRFFPPVPVIANTIIQAESSIPTLSRVVTDQSERSSMGPSDLTTVFQQNYIENMSAIARGISSEIRVKRVGNSKSVSEVDDNTLSVKFNSRVYSGAEEYASLSVMENLELYFREQVFGTYKQTGEGPYIKYGQNDRTRFSKSQNRSSDVRVSETSIDGEEEIEFIPPPARPERFMALFLERVVEIEKKKPWRPPSPGPYNSQSDSLRLSENKSISSNKAKIPDTTPIQPKSKSQGSPVAPGQVVEPVMIIALTNSTIYFLQYEELEGALFRDAPIPTLVNSHDVVDLMYCTIFFGFQRCILSFASPHLSLVDDPSSERSYAFIELNNIEEISEEHLCSYIILTRDKSHTYPIITKIPQISNASRGLIANGRPYKNVRINNRDSELLSVVSQTVSSLDNGSHDPDVVHYSMVYQVWRKHPGVALPRTIILTPTLLLLCEENLKSKNVNLVVLDSAAVKDVYKIHGEDDPLLLTIILKSSNKSMLGFSGRRKWRIKADLVTSISKLHEDCRRICIEHGNTDI